MRTQGTKFVPLLILVTLLSLVFSGQPAIAKMDVPSVTPEKHTLGVSPTGLYIVQLNDASLAAYKGGIAGLKATSPEATGARRLDTSTVESKAYLRYLEGKQQALLGNMEKAFKHPVEVAHQYKNVLNAVAVRISHAEALLAFNLPDVKTVYPDGIREMDTDVGPELIGAPAIWENDVPGGVGTFGEGIVIGVIDSGVNHAHPSFADVGGDGFNHENPNGAGSYFGVCASDPAYADFCNDKLIGAYDLTQGGSGGPEDEDGHGSHTSSTAGGNVVDLTFNDGAGGTFPVTISGVAPHANIIAYRVCNDDGGCEFAATVAAVDHAIADGVSVLNYSISGSDDPWADAVDLAFLDAFTAGIFVSASAGNDGPAASTVAKTGPWNAAVAASTHSRILAHPLDVVTPNGDATDDLLGLGAAEGTGPMLAADFTAPLLWGGDVDPANIESCTAWAAGSFTGKIGMVQRGTCAFADKVNNLAAAGAVGALVYNNVSGPPTVMGGLEATTIPSMMISLEDGLLVVDLIDGLVPADATMYVAQNFVYNEDWADIMAGFSSRGPSQWELVKPDYTGPGVNILAAVAALDGDPLQFDFYQGTSMSSPHGAGSAALLMALHPDWSPAAVKSAIALTADQDVLDSDGVTPATPFAMGSGRIDLEKAVYTGFVMEETSANYIAANPYLGGEPNTLNQPSMVEYACILNCNWTRTFKSTLGVDQAYTVSFVTSDPALSLSAIPSSFTLAAGGTQSITVNANMTTAVPDVYYFGDVVVSPVGITEIPAVHLPVVAKLSASNLPAELDILTDQTTGTVTMEDLQSAYNIPELQITVSGMAEGSYTNLQLVQDPTNSDAFNDLNEVYTKTIQVAGGTKRLVAEIAASEAMDVDLFVGSGNKPSEDTLLCVSASGIWAEYCNVDFPTAGQYWVLVQNWQGSTDPANPDDIRLVTGLVKDTDLGNLTVTTDNLRISTGKLFDLDVNWNEPSLEVGDFWYAQFALGTDPANPENLGYTNVDLEFFQKEFAVDLAPDTQDGYGDPGATVSHVLTVTNNGNFEDTYNLSFAGNTWVTALSQSSVTLAAGASVNIAMDVTVPADALPAAMDSVTVTAVSVADPLVTESVVANTYANTLYLLSLAPETDAASGAPEDVLTYTLTLTNLGNIEDTVSLAYAGNLWDVTLSHTEVVLPVGGSVDVTVTVTIPATAANLETDVVTVTATSTSLAEYTSVLTTTAEIPVVYEYLWLPLVINEP